ncbi:MAG: glycoside hydrolase family 57 protein, partial [Chloroflexia bacterium]
MRRMGLLFALLALLLSGCGPAPTPTPSPTSLPTPPSPTPTPLPSPEQVLFVAIIWHQHQPLYYKDPQTGLYAKPWVRVHAAKDYVDMATLVEQYPRIHVTFNLTPSLLRQLDDIASGARDVYWATTEVPADRLTEEQKVFLLQRFFDTNRKVIARFPRYQELLEKRGTDLSDAGLRATAARWTEQDFRDLQVLFNLAWTDPDWRAQEPLRALVEKGRNFEEADKAIVLGEHLRLVKEVVPVHRRLQEAGQIEVTMTPYAHPILPLLVDTTQAKIARPDIDLPREAFSYGRDAQAQVQKGVQFYEEHFGQPPRGMWPAEGAVSQLIVTMVSQAGIQWMASDEDVLAYSLGLPGFTRDAQETVQEADTLYRPYSVSDGRNPPVAILFRDRTLSDKIGFTYSGTKGDLAAADFVQRLHAIKDRLQAEGAKGPHLVTVILDGENAWEYYENDGKEFLHSLYRLLSEDPELVTVTPSEYLARFPEMPAIETLWAGSWIDHDFATWIGEDEENRAWEDLGMVRDFLQEYVSGKRKADEAVLAQALDLMYAAEGSDWFWWYGADQDSGD